MKLKSDEVWGAGVSIPPKKKIAVHRLIESILASTLSLEGYETLLIGVTVIDEDEFVLVPEKQTLLGTFEVECKYPISKLSEMLIDERVAVYAQILLKAVYKFYEHHDQKFKEIDMITDRLVEEGIIAK